jgi:hypothetical protein
MIKAIKRRSNPRFSLLPAYDREVIKNAARLPYLRDATSGTYSIARPAEDRSDERPLTAEPGTAAA